MEKHVGVAPDPYEPEWCVEQAVLYRDCRADVMEAAAAAAAVISKAKANPPPKSG
jgi:hypothetical protein